jgi:formiminotetrahydrofolate cyclodeaminase
MKENLLDLTTRALLKKFGAGDHKPGSGSAAAFQGMLSAHLLRTVIFLTLHPDRIEYYKAHKKQLMEFDKDLQEIIPKLEKLFLEDSSQFDKVINLREKRNDAKDLNETVQYEREHLKELKGATDIPIEIAQLCEKIAIIGDFVFENGFQSARGDTCVAQNNAVSAIQGCISIVDLNLLSFHSNDWTKQKRTRIDRLTKRLQNLYKLSQKNSSILQEECKKRHFLQEEINTIINKVKGKNAYKNSEIEEIASAFQNIIWKNKQYLWRKDIDDPINILKPDIVLKKILGYQYYNVASLDNNQLKSKTAGIIDQKEKVVYISKKFQKVEQNFTTAHELGHAIFHNQTVIHRDRPLDGSRETDPKNFTEYQADKFATYFLMPSKQIREVFFEWFGTSRFVVNENNSYRLIGKGPSDLRLKFRNLHQLARELASTNKFGPITNLVPMASLFRVSVGAMAIRLEELDLIEY